MSTIDFNHLSNLIPASLSPESAEELATALSTGRWWAIMEVLHPIDEERQFDFTSVYQSQTVEDDRKFSASGPAETADASSVPEASDELATALAAGAIMEVERPIEEPQVDISSVQFLEAPETSPGASVPENGEPTTSPVLKSQIEPSGAPGYAESDTPGYLFFGYENPTPALTLPASSDNGDVCQMASAKPKDPKRFRRFSRCRRSPTLLKIREAWLKAFADHMPLQNQQHVELVASRGQNRIPEEQQQDEPGRLQQRDLNEIIHELLSGLQSARPLRTMREPQDEAFVNQMPHQNQQHEEVVASRGQNQIPEPQPEEQQQDEPERPQQRDLVVNGRVRGVLRGLQSARPLRRMRQLQDEAIVNHMPDQNQQHVEAIASRGQNQIPEPQPEEQQQDEPERPQQRDLVVNGRVRGVLRGLQSARPLRRRREQDDIVNLQNPPLRPPLAGPPPTYIRRMVVGNNGDFARH